MGPSVPRRGRIDQGRLFDGKIGTSLNTSLNALVHESALKSVFSPSAAAEVTDYDTMRQKFLRGGTQGSSGQAGSRRQSQRIAIYLT